MAKTNINSGIVEKYDTFINLFLKKYLFDLNWFDSIKKQKHETHNFGS